MTDYEYGLGVAADNGLFIQCVAAHEHHFTVEVGGLSDDDADALALVGHPEVDVLHVVADPVTAEGLREFVERAVETTGTTGPFTLYPQDLLPDGAA